MARMRKIVNVHWCPQECKQYGSVKHNDPAAIIQSERLLFSRADSFAQHFLRIIPESSIDMWEP